jgi:hypothetical protein
VKHNFAVQKYSRAPFNLKTNVAVIPHPEGFLATLEWKWFDPDHKGGAQLVAVTSGVATSKKLAISEACRAMLLKQKIIDDSVSAHSELLSEMNDFMKSGHYIRATKLLLSQVDNAIATNTAFNISQYQSIFQEMWRNIVATHDYQTTESLVYALEKSTDGIPISLYEFIIQELVYISNFSFSERVLLLLANERIRLVPPISRGLTTPNTNPVTPEEVAKFKYWRSLLAIEESTNIHAGADDSKPVMKHVKVDTVSFPLIRLILPDGADMVTTDSLVMMIEPGCGQGLTGTVTSVSTNPDGITSVSVQLLTEEGKHASLILTSDFVDITVLSESRITFERMIFCIREFFRVSDVPDGSFRFTDIMRGILGGVSRPPSKESSIANLPDLVHEKRYLNLSDAQLSAVTSALTSPLTIVHGPPGTGKTHTLCGIISAWSGSRGKILACADSNAAADHIYASLKRKGVKDVFRLSTWRSIVDDIDEDTLSRIRNRAAVEKYKIAVGAFQRNPAKNRGYLIGARKTLEEEAVAQNRIIVTTLSSSRHVVLDKQIFPRVVIDESSQTIEPAALLAVSHGCEQLVLVGDHLQLPPVVLNREAVKMGMKQSLFERLIRAGGDESKKFLNVQRRMHPCISKFSNENFYDGKIVNHAACVDTDVEIPWITKDKRVVFIHVDRGEEMVGTSTRNLGECIGIVNLVSRMMAEGIPADRMGIIVPYLAQRAALQTLMREHIPRSFMDALLINTVEGFQGNERDYILISLVRSNSGGHIGFIDDDQRMNVMLTRAKKGVFVFGDRKTFELSRSRWSDWLKWCTVNGICLDFAQISSPGTRLV